MCYKVMRVFHLKYLVKINVAFHMFFDFPFVHTYTILGHGLQNYIYYCSRDKIVLLLLEYQILSFQQFWHPNLIRFQLC